MAPSYDEFDENELSAHLETAASIRGQKFRARQEGDEWVAELVDAPAQSVGTISSGPSPDRRAAMLRLAWMIED